MIDSLSKTYDTFASRVLMPFSVDVTLLLVHEFQKTTIQCGDVT